MRSNGWLPSHYRSMANSYSASVHISQNNSEYLKEANSGINFDEKAYSESLDLKNQLDDQT